MTEATQWEYAMFRRGQSSDYIQFHWAQGDQFVAQAREWFEDSLKMKESQNNYLSLKMGNKSDQFAIAFMGTHGWELVDVVNQSSSSGTLFYYWFKRPSGNANIASRPSG